jgi:TetR/AcrR family transcriptional regulator, transcriptional repressor for nem operon
VETQRARRGPKPKPGTRDNLIQAGLKLIHAEGYSASGIQSIVAQADVPKGSFYTYFASKEAFGGEVLDAYAESAFARTRALLGKIDLGPRARLEAYFDDLIGSYKASKFARGCLLGNFSAEAADQSAMIRRHLAKLFQTCILEGQQKGEIADQFSAAALADFILNSWEGALLRMRVEKSDAPLLEFKTMIFCKILG